MPCLSSPFDSACDGHRTVEKHGRDGGLVAQQADLGRDEPSDAGDSGVVSAGGLVGGAPQGGF